MDDMRISIINITLYKNYFYDFNIQEETKITLNINTGSILLMSPFTLHKTIPNFHKEPRFAMPITIRNFYYPQKGNEDLWEFRKLKESVYSKLRKKLGNNLFTPYRTIDINQK